nr:hypothetical protein [Tanacetum cinerariifolium]
MIKIKTLQLDQTRKSPTPETLDPEWNTVKTLDDTPEQLWFNEMIQVEKPPLTFDDLMSGKESGYGYMKEIVIRRADQNLYKIKEGDFLDLHLNGIKDMMLLIAQKKLFNLDGDVIVDFVTALKMFTQGISFKNKVKDVQLGVESYQRKLNLTKPQRTCKDILIKKPYTPNYDPLGIIYEDKNKEKRLMRLNEIHKFYDETLQSVQNFLRDTIKACMRGNIQKRIRD